MEEPGEGQTQNGSQEEHADDYLFLEGGYEGLVGPEHVHEPQTQEEQAAWVRRERHRERRRKRKQKSIQV